MISGAACATPPVRASAVNSQLVRFSKYVICPLCKAKRCGFLGRGLVGLGLAFAFSWGETEAVVVGAVGNRRETVNGQNDPKIADELLLSVQLCRGMKSFDRALAILGRPCWRASDRSPTLRPVLGPPSWAVRTRHDGRAIEDRPGPKREGKVDYGQNLWPYRNMDVSIAEAKNRLPEIIRAVERGEDVIITRHGKAVAQITRPPAGAKAGAARRNEGPHQAAAGLG